MIVSMPLLATLTLLSSYPTPGSKNIKLQAIQKVIFIILVVG
jgi:hypothetical protein